MTFQAIDVQVDFEGVNFIIAHLRVGSMQIALGQPIDTTPPKGEGIHLIFLHFNKID